MSETNENLNSQKLKCEFSNLMSNGKWLFVKGDYENAIKGFTAALSLKPDDRTCLVGRSKCYLKIGQLGNALKDAEASLNDDKSFFEGLYQKAEALYYQGEFEFALMFYDRGQKIRPQIQGFRLGIQKAQEALENSIGSPSSVQLEIKQDVLHKYDEANLAKEKKHPTKKISKNEKMTKELLGEFYRDKKFLEDLMKDKGRTRRGEQLQDIIQSCLKSLDTCTEFWNQEKPISQERNRQHIQQKCRASSEPAQFLLRSFDDIDAELTSGNAEGSVKKAEEVMKIVQRWSEKEVPNKKELLGNLHSCIGNALFDLGDMDKALEHHQKDLDLAKQCKLPEAKSRALDNMGRTYAQIGQFEQAIEFWEMKISLVCGGFEKTWLLHEIGCCYMELNRYKEARDYGVLAAAAAGEIGDGKWLMNANVLVAQSELKLGNFKSSVSYFEEALIHARFQDDDSAMNAIKKAIDEVKQHLR
ncbi:outer dynein arm-docking complex subunit 4 isoform X2 [Melanotaenia boesemani]|uniref:outer dynein arm-docking complex subunit 4 isoform X2 n=1 Tax=Melanotaenia boesemani TaxID=1250792 RepID=UPI001C03D5B7|nr:outer dynein arm-docking complex subunit 4 isoform X2 [Melanotaenia boesemani]